VCVCVCLSVRDHIFRTTRPIFNNFLCMLPMAVIRSCSGGVCYPVLWMISYLLLSQGCWTSRLAEAQCTCSLGLGYKLYAIILVAGQRTHRTTFIEIFIRRKTVATQKHSSASINTNEAETMTKSITVVDSWYWSINKILYIIIFVHQT